MKLVQIPPQRWWENAADLLMKPLMYLLSGTFSEEPQRTHRWNNFKFHRAVLNARLTLKFPGVPEAKNRWLFGIIPLFHLPIFGGWRNYVVIEPVMSQSWHIGWRLSENQYGGTKIRLTGPVRVLLSSMESEFFGLDALGNQIEIEQIGRGQVGKGGPYSHLPLL